MKEGYVIREQEKAHFITATVVDWIDVFPAPQSLPTLRYNNNPLFEEFLKWH